VAGTWSAPKDGGENGAPLRLETEHFAFYWKDGTNITDADAKAAGVTLESISPSLIVPAVKNGRPLYILIIVFHC
jgi:hypothetical protein